MDRLTQIRQDQRQQWIAGNSVLVEFYLAVFPDIHANGELLLDLICSEVMLRRQFGQSPTAEEYAKRFPDLAEELRRQIEFFNVLDLLADSQALTPTPNGPTLPMPASAIHPPPPETVGNFLILEKIGEGSHGVVYSALQRSLNRRVALKMLRHGSAPKERFLSLSEEAKAVAQLQHVNIAQVFEYGEDGDRPFLVMELIQGGDLKKLLEQKPLPLHRVVEVVEVVARAIFRAHQNMILHGDLKPANILLNADGVPKIVDFGIARHLGAEETVEAKQTLVGTPRYMAPEQMPGATVPMGPATDQFALGIILDEVCRAAPPSPELEDLKTISLRCQERNPEDRYRDTLALADDLFRFRHGEPIAARRLTRTQKLMRTVRRYPRALAGILTGIFLFVLALGGALQLGRFWATPPTPTPEPKPEELQASLVERLSKGETLRWKGDESVPGPFRELLVPEDWGFHSTQAKDAFVLNGMRGHTLMELLNDPGVDRYRFSAEVRHDESSGISNVGLFWGHRGCAGPEGIRQDGWFSLTYSDRGLSTEPRQGKAEPESHVTLRFTMQSAKLPGPVVAATQLGGKHQFRPARPLGKPAPWRAIAVEVTPDGVKTYWKESADYADWQPIVVDEKNFDGTEKTLVSRTKSLVSGNRHFNAMPTKVSPRMPLGLYVEHGVASFRRLALEPLPAKPISAP